MSSEFSPAYTHAVDYAHAGLAVFPLRARDKRPVTEHGVKDATTKTDKIHRWFILARDLNVAIATGAVSDVVVLDVDGDDGLASLRELLQRCGKRMPKTPTVATGKGMHLYFKHPGGTIKNGVRILPGLDIRGDGGYAVAPPSVHPSGDRYRWEIGLDVPFAPVPDFLLETVFKPAEEARQTRLGGPEVVPAGRRNDTAFRDAAAMRARGVSRDGILAMLRADNGVRYIPPLEDEELERIADSAARYAPDVERVRDEEWRDRQRAREDAGKPELRLRVTVTNPKTWHLAVGENEVKLTTEQLQSWPKVRSAFVEQLMMLPPWEPKNIKGDGSGRPRSEWPDRLAELLPLAEKIDAPEELTTHGRVLEFTRVFCARHSKTAEGLLRGQVWYDAERDSFVFRTADMVHAVDRDFGLAKGLDARLVNEVLRDMLRGEVRNIRVGKRVVKAMVVPAAELGITSEEEPVDDAEE